MSAPSPESWSFRQKTTLLGSGSRSRHAITESQRKFPVVACISGLVTSLHNFSQGHAVGQSGGGERTSLPAPPRLIPIISSLSLCVSPVRNPLQPEFFELTVAAGRPARDRKSTRL